ncbi:MAG TPA: glycosyltransferase, partial [Bacteroidales bacterium]|nr:glycosyltransferase [Bacteroidales bacterium]
MPGLFIRYQAEALVPFCDVAVLYVHPDEKAVNKYEVVISEEQGVHTVRIYYRVKSGDLGSRFAFRVSNILLLRYIRFLVACRKGFRVLREFHPDLVHVHVLTRHGVVAWLRKTCSGTPYVITEHWSRYLLQNNTYKGFFRKIFTRMAVRGASAVVAVSPALKEAMQENGLDHRNFRVIPNPVETGKFRILESSREKEGSTKKILHVSCFDDRSKNISGFLRV